MPPVVETPTPNVPVPPTPGTTPPVVPPETTHPNPPQPVCPPDAPNCKDPKLSPDEPQGHTPAPAPEGPAEVAVPIETNPVKPDVAIDAPIPAPQEINAPHADPVVPEQRKPENIPAPVQAVPENNTGSQPVVVAPPANNPGQAIADPDAAAAAPVAPEPAPAASPNAESNLAPAPEGPAEVDIQLQSSTEASGLSPYSALLAVIAFGLTLFKRRRQA